MKKVVHYESGTAFVNGLGGRAILKPINHPDRERVSNTTLALTGRVVAYNAGTGRIETENTIYKPRKVSRDGDSNW